MDLDVAMEVIEAIRASYPGSTVARTAGTATVLIERAETSAPLSPSVIAS
jgi:hypothetical protein